jgi:hypothetical protein
LLQPIASTAATASASMCDRFATGRKKVLEKIRPVIDVDQNIAQIGLGESRLDQPFRILIESGLSAVFKATR